MKSQELQIVNGYHVMMNSLRSIKKVREETEMDTFTETLITRYFDGKKSDCLALSLVDTKGKKKNTYFAVAKF